ncbi:MAG: outer membrane protein OmpA-like peptidoglycan-associated protein [Cognaticolwellia sp.]|jgi:outer membrane protein OmpA-like peptidoglycan-associated protein
MFGLTACLLLASAPAAQAQELPEGDTDRLRYNSLSERMWRSADAQWVRGSGYSLSALGQVVDQPGVTIDPVTGESTVFLERAAGPILAASVYHERLRVGLALPLYTSSSASGVSQGFVPGEAALDFRAILLPGSSGTLGLAVVGGFVWPLGESSALLSPAGMGASGGVIVDYSLGRTLWVLNSRLHWAEESQLSVAMGPFASFDAGVAVGVSERIDLSAEVATDTQLDRFLGLGQGTAVEATAGLRFAASERLFVRTGLGRGLSDGIGAPNWRVLAGVTWAPPAQIQDLDADGLSDVRDKCPEVAEDLDGYQDHDGCPDSDNDSDGIVDVADSCPLDAEDVDGWRDGDGCPEDERELTLVFLDWGGRPVDVDQLDLRPLGRGDPVGASDVGHLDIRLDRGNWELRAIDQDFETLIQGFEVPAGDEPLEIVVQLTLGGPVGQARVVVTDSDGRPIPEYTVLMDDNTNPIQGQDGDPLLQLRPGSHSLVVQVEGFADQRVDLEMQAGQLAAVYAKMQPILVTLGADYIELTEPLGFAPGSPQLTPQSELALQQIAELLLAHPELQKVRIEVHTAAGTPDILSQRRANALVSYLVSLGVPRGRLAGVGFGSAFPVSELPAENERVSFFVEAAKP